MEALDVLRDALNDAQTELGAAEIALCEANARAEQARGEHAKLGAAVAALSGEPPPAATTQDNAVAGAAATKDASSSAAPKDDNTPSGDPITEMTPEEFDAHRKKRQRQKEKEFQANNPYAQVKCSGCGQLGTMQDTIITAPSGAPVRMMTCGSCGNQIMQ